VEKVRTTSFAAPLPRLASFPPDEWNRDLMFGFPIARPLRQVGRGGYANEAERLEEPHKKRL